MGELKTRDYTGFLEKLQRACPKLKCGRGIVRGGDDFLQVYYHDLYESGFPNYVTSRIDASVSFYDNIVRADFSSDKFSEPQSPDIRDLGQEAIHEEYSVNNALRGAYIENNGILLVVQGLALPYRISSYFDFGFKEPEIVLD